MQCAEVLVTVWQVPVCQMLFVHLVVSLTSLQKLWEPPHGGTRMNWADLEG